MIGVGSKISTPYIRPRLILFVFFLPISKQKWQISPSLWASRAFPIKRSISDWGFKWSCGRIGDSALAGNCCHFRIWGIGKRNWIIFPGVNIWWRVLNFNWHSRLSPLSQLISCWRLYINFWLSFNTLVPIFIQLKGIIVLYSTSENWNSTSGKVINSIG